jgi:excisionase family DNA binding protein
MNGTRPPPDALLNKQQVADLLNVSTRTLDRLRSQRLLEAVKIRSRVLFHPDVVSAFIQKSTSYRQGEN